MLPLPPGLRCLSAFCIYLPQPRLTGAQPRSLTRGCTPHQLPGKFRPRIQGETAGICWLLGSVLMPFALPRSRTCAASHSSWADVAHGVCCLVQNEGPAV